MPKLKKPTPKPRRALYDYSEIIDYIERKYNINTRDYAGKFSASDAVQADIPYQDFWHWVVDHCGVNNGCEIVLSSADMKFELKSCKTEKEIKAYYTYNPKFVIEIMDLIEKEFGDEVECWVSW